MNLNSPNTCPHCGSTQIKIVKNYETVHNGMRPLYHCTQCHKNFSKTYGTPMATLKTPLSKIASVLRVRSEGLGQRATGRIFGIHKNTVAEWEARFAEQKTPLMLYALCHEFISLTFEGDELYTITGQRVDACDCQGWTAVVMERASRFIVAQHCGQKDAQLFEEVMNSVASYLEQSGDVTFLSDGERRYGNSLFELCAEVIKTGQRGRPPKALPEGLKVRLKNKGSQSSKPGRKRPKYQAPHREHPNTAQTLDSSDIHANHLEAYNAALRRRNSAFRRRTNTYAKLKTALQRTLDVHQIIHNFVRIHWTTGQVPAVALGILMAPLSLEDILTQRFA
jgi:transposase-like protein